MSERPKTWQVGKIHQSSVPDTWAYCIVQGPESETVVVNMRGVACAERAKGRAEKVAAALNADEC